MLVTADVEQRFQKQLLVVRRCLLLVPVVLVSLDAKEMQRPRQQQIDRRGASSSWFLWIRTHTFTCVALLTLFVIVPIGFVLLSKTDIWGWVTSFNWLKLMYPHCPDPFGEEDDRQHARLTKEAAHVQSLASDIQLVIKLFGKHR
jgi:hypothetical protein